MTKMQKRIGMATAGSVLLGIAVGFMRIANFGLDPFASTVQGVANLLGTGYGNSFLLVTGALFGVTLLLDRSMIGVATFVNLFLLGYIADATVWGMTAMGFQPQLAGRILMLILGVGIICIASSLYFTANLGVSAYDAMALIATKRKIASFRVCRTAGDMLCVVLGMLMGCMPGAGTVLVAFCMGPLIQYLNRVMSIPLLEGKGMAKSV